MTPVAVIALAIDAVLTLVVSVTSGLVLLLVKRRGDRERGRDELLTRLGGDMRSLREGMSMGAERAFAQLAGRVSLLEDDSEQTGRKLTELQAEYRALDRVVEGHIRTPGSYAHPPPGLGPVPA